MPITAIYSQKFTNRARKEEGLTPAQASKVLSDMPADWLHTLTAYFNEPSFEDGAIDLKALRQAFPTIIPVDDAAAFFILRIAIAEAGAMAV